MKTGLRSVWHNGRQIYGIDSDIQAAGRKFPYFVSGKRVTVIWYHQLVCVSRNSTICWCVCHGIVPYAGVCVTV